MTLNTNSPRISPFLFCTDVKASAHFLEVAFGLTQDNIDAEHARLRLGESQVFLSAAHEESRLVPASQTNGLHALVMVYLASSEELEALIVRARDAGATVDYGPDDRPYGQREAGVRDLDNNLWIFATALP